MTTRPSQHEAGRRISFLMEEGACARRAGKPRSANTHKHDEEASGYWQAGWEKEDDRIFSVLHKAQAEDRARSKK